MGRYLLSDTKGSSSAVLRHAWCDYGPHRYHFSAGERQGVFLSAAPASLCLTLKHGRTEFHNLNISREKNVHSVRCCTNVNRDLRRTTVLVAPSLRGVVRKDDNPRLGWQAQRQRGFGVAYCILEQRGGQTTCSLPQRFAEQCKFFLS
jgi:hypothetical protein